MAAAFFLGRGLFQISDRETIYATQEPAPEGTAVSTTPTSTATATAPATATATGTAVPVETAAPAATAVANPTCTDIAALVSDLSIPDGSQIAPGVPFDKSWRLKNTGTCTWNTGYSLVFAGGNTLGSLANSFPLDATVAPGELVDVSVAFTGPTTPGTYQSDWKLQNSRGQIFGIGANGGPFWVKITIPSAQNSVISGFVYQDANYNGLYNSGEVLMGSREIWLVAGSACHVRQEPVAVTYSDGNGRYTFSGNYSGSFCVGSVGDDGLFTDVASVAIAPGQTLNDIHLRWPVPDGSISGFVWNDYCLTNENGLILAGNCVADGNGGYRADGMISPDEGYISGITVLLQLGGCANNDNAAVPAVTDGSGKYFFGDLQPATYCIFIDANAAGNAARLLPGSWTFPGNGRWYQEITLLGADQAYPVNFGWDYQLQ